MIEKTHVVSKVLLNSLFLLLGKSSNDLFIKTIKYNLNFNYIGRKTH